MPHGEKYQTARLISSCVLRKGDRVLFLEELGPNGKHLSLPGGHIEIAETPEEAAVREAREETGFDVELERLVGVFALVWPNGKHSVRFLFEATIIGGDETPETDSSFHWMTADAYQQWDGPKVRALDEMARLAFAPPSETTVQTIRIAS